MIPVPDLQASLDAGRAEPLYLQVAADLMRRIGSEDDFRDRLPTEAALCARYAVSRITIRQALDHLEKRGVIVRRQGRGTFVSVPKTEPPQSAIYSFADILRGQGLEPETALLSFGLAHASVETREALSLPGDEALALRRGFMVNGPDGRPQRVAVTEVHYPPAFKRHITEAIARENSSAIILTRVLDLQIDHASILIDVRPLSREAAQWLGMEPGAPIMRIRRITYCAGHGACEFSQLFITTGLAEFTVDAQGRIIATPA